MTTLNDLGRGAGSCIKCINWHDIVEIKIFYLYSNLQTDNFAQDQVGFSPSVTIKNSPNVYKSCPKMISLEKVQ